MYIHCISAALPTRLCSHVVLQKQGPDLLGSQEVTGVFRAESNQRCLLRQFRDNKCISLHSQWGTECLSLPATNSYFEFQVLTVMVLGEGNGNPLQYSCLENPRDGGAWWAAVYVVAQSRTQLKRLSSSSSSSNRSSLWYVGFFFSCSMGNLLVVA